MGGGGLLRVLTKMRVFLQKCSDFLRKILSRHLKWMFLVIMVIIVLIDQRMVGILLSINFGLEAKNFTIFFWLISETRWLKLLCFLGVKNFSVIFWSIRCFWTVCVGVVCGISWDGKLFELSGVLVSIWPLVISTLCIPVKEYNCVGSQRAYSFGLYG